MAQAPRRRLELVAYAGAVVVGGVLMVITAYTQPYNQNELQQMASYGSSDVDEITSGTRQPPLDPLLGAAVQHLLGVGQLEQRLVPVTSGILALTLMVLLLRRLRLGLAGVVAAWAMATAPLLVRYAAYTRPYALPMMLMMAAVYAAVRFEESNSRRWLLLLAAAAAAMPATRVPEPNVFLVAMVVIMAWRLWRRRIPRAVGIPLLVIPLAAIAVVGYPMYRSLASKTSNVFDPSLGGFIDRFPEGVREIFTGFLPTLSHYTPWWPLLVLAAAAVLALPRARERLASWWFFWPLLAAPVVFALAYHFLNPFPFSVRPYRIRMAIFFVPPLALVVAALADAARDVATRSVRTGAVVGGLVAALVLTQIPNTARMVTENEAPDFGQVADVLASEVPDDAIVLYDSFSTAGRWRMPFLARPRYMGDTPYAEEVVKLARAPAALPKDGPVFVLVLDSTCSTSVVCDGVQVPWDMDVDGWHLVHRFDRFRLYAPDEPLDGRTGVAKAMVTWGRDLKPRFSYPEYFLAARLLAKSGRDDRARNLIERMYDRAGAYSDEIRKRAQQKRLDPF